MRPIDARQSAQTSLAHLDELPLARVAMDGDLDVLAGAPSDERATDGRCRRDHREEAIAAGAGELGAGAHREHDEGALLGAALALDGDVDNRAERHRARR